MEFMKGLKSVLQRIKQNNAGQTLTHQEIRAYARCFLAVAKAEGEDDELIALLTALAARGLPHYDRAFLAERMLEIVNKKIEILFSDRY
jgi:thymidine phosphorylase